MRGAILVIGLAVAGAVGGLVLLVRALPPRAEDVPEAAVTIVPRSRPVVAPEPPASSAPQVPDTSTEAERRAAADAVNEFGLELFRRLAEQEKGDLVYSPYSVAAALAMASVGARGETEAEMLRVLRLDRLGDRRHSALDGLSRRLITPGTKEGPELHIANGVWPRAGRRMVPAFVRITADHYRAAARPLDYLHNPEGARQEINRWVAGKTRDKIPELLKPNKVGPNTEMVLTNALYYLGRWAKPFRKDRSTPGLFFPADGNALEVRMMNRTDQYRYFEDDQVQVLELPYQDSSLVMLLVLPRRGKDGIRLIEQGLTIDRMQIWARGLQPRQVQVTVPAFTLRTGAELTNLLTSMGIKLAFSPAADFSGMCIGRVMQIVVLIHEAYLDVNEQGTEAAAAAGVVFGRLGGPRFTADRPFLYLVYDRTIKGLLLTGRVETGRGLRPANR